MINEAQLPHNKHNEAKLPQPTWAPGFSTCSHNCPSHRMRPRVVTPLPALPHSTTSTILPHTSLHIWALAHLHTPHCNLIFDSRKKLHSQHELLSSFADAVPKIAQAVRATMVDCLKRHCNCCCVCCSRFFLYLF